MLVFSPTLWMASPAHYVVLRNILVILFYYGVFIISVMREVKLILLGSWRLLRQICRQAFLDSSATTTSTIHHQIMNA